MPAGFDKCEKEGGNVRRITGPSERYGLKAGEHVNICFDKSGTMHKGYTKSSKPESKVPGRQEYKS